MAILKHWRLGTFLLVLAALAYWMVSPFISAVLANGTINVTRADYNAALNKWRAQGVEEYEITTSYTVKGCELDPLICGTWTLRVRGNNITIVDHQFNEMTFDDPIQSEALKFLTVEGSFNEVDGLLRALFLKADGIPPDYTVEFDPDMGYPTTISRFGRSPSGRFESSHVYHVGQYMEVESLKVLKRKP